MTDPRPTNPRPIKGFKKPFWNITIKGEMIKYEFIPSETEDNEKRYKYALRYLPKGGINAN
jgi:hypothetical protein